MKTATTLRVSAATSGAIALAVLALTSCDKLRSVDPALAEAQADVAKAQTFIIDNAKDPTSVQWGTIWVFNRQVCGFLNAKNSFGGYTGYRRFWTHGDVVMVDSMFDKEWIAVDAFNRTCSRAEQVMNIARQPHPTAEGFLTAAQREAINLQAASGE